MGFFNNESFFGSRKFYLMVIIVILIAVGLYFTLGKLDLFGYLKGYIGIAVFLVIGGTIGFVIYWSLMGRSSYS